MRYDYEARGHSLWLVNRAAADKDGNVYMRGSAPEIRNRLHRDG